MVGVSRFEFREPGRQSPNNWPSVIGLKIFGIEIEWNIGWPELIKGFHHAAAILLPPRQIASGMNNETHRSTKVRDPPRKCSLVIIASLFNLNLAH
jgi:hypothetical protein